MSSQDTPGVLAPPPLIFAAALLLGWLLGRALPPPVPSAVVLGAGGLLAVAALLLAGMSIREMRRTGTAVDPYAPSTALVRSGPFARSRNPIYVALILLSVGLALLLNLLWAVLLLPLSVFVLRRFVIAREEVYLQRRFGDDYSRYCAATRRWF